MSKLSTADRLRALAEQRGQLLERIGQQRVVLQGHWAPVARAVGRGDRALAALDNARQFAHAHRATFALALAVAGAALVLARPGRFLQLLKSGVVLWRGWRFVQSARAAGPVSWRVKAREWIRRWLTHAS